LLTFSEIIKKLKSKKGGAEGVMFLSGMLLLTVVIVFSLNVFDLTWQRYVVKREIGNVSRLYAIRWTELYIKSNCDGNFETCSTIPTNSKLGEEIQNIMELTVKEGNLDNAELVVSKNTGDTCSSPGVLLCVRTDGSGNTTISGQSWDIAKLTGYGDVLYTSLDVKYTWNSTLRTARKQDGYKLENKFASERAASDQNLIGS